MYRSHYRRHPTGGASRRYAAPTESGGPEAAAPGFSMKRGIEDLPPSPGPLDRHWQPCGCCGDACEFGDDAYDEIIEEVEPEADYCGELSWPDTARMVGEIDILLFDCPTVSRMLSWVESVAKPRWRASRAKMALSPEAFALLSRVVHRVSGIDTFRLRYETVYRPATRFVMRHPQCVDQATAPAVMLKMPSPVGWIQATRDQGGGLSYRYDNSRIQVDMGALTEASYGVTWAERVAPSPRPVLASPEEMERIPPDDQHWYVYSPGVQGWIPARRTAEGHWVQTLDGTDIRYPIWDVQGDEYGTDCGVLAPLYRGDLDRVYDRLVVHPQYRAKWVGAYASADGRLFVYSYPSDIEVDVDLSPDNFNRTWCWPPALVD